MRKMKDSSVEWVATIPENWNEKKIKYTSTYNDEVLGEKTYSDFEFNYIDIGSVEESSGVTNYQRFLFKDSPSRARRIVQDGDTILSTVRTYLKAVAYINDFCFPQISSTGFLIIRPNETEIYPRFIYYSVLSHHFISKVEAYSVGISYPAINASEVANFKIFVPPMDEQHRIADYLDAQCAKIDSTIAKTQQIIEKLKAYKQSVITEAVTKGLNPDAPMKDSGIEWIGEIPEHWSGDTLARRVLFEGGSQPPLENFIDEPREGYVRLIQNRDYKTSDYATYVPSHMVTKFCNEDDIMIGRYGPPVFVLHKGLSGAYNVATIKAVPNGIDKDFLWFYLQNYTLRKYVEASSQRTAGQSGVNPNIFKKYPIFLPDESEQQEIASYLDDKCAKIDGYITKKQEVIDKLTAYKKSLIFEVVTGKKEI